MEKNAIRRMRRAKKTRVKLKKLEIPRLSVHITLKHVYAQVFNADGNKVLASASTLDKEVKALVERQTANIKNAALVGKMIANRAITAGIKKVGFDRSGFKYHGCVKALAEAAREGGLIF